MEAPRILLIDNRDSFTYNLLHYLQEAGAQVEVCLYEELSKKNMAAAAYSYEGTVISPGPYHPDDYPYYSELMPVLLQKALLGVCLGHQLLARWFGGEVIRAPYACHGKASTMRIISPCPLYQEMETLQSVGRYHSLHVIPRPGWPLKSTAVLQNDEDILMSFAHCTLPAYGIQYHPESILTPHGKKIISNFVKQCARQS